MRAIRSRSQSLSGSSCGAGDRPGAVPAAKVRSGEVAAALLRGVEGKEWLWPGRSARDYSSEGFPRMPGDFDGPESSAQFRDGVVFWRYFEDGAAYIRIEGENPEVLAWLRNQLEQNRGAHGTQFKAEYRTWVMSSGTQPA